MPVAGLARLRKHQFGRQLVHGTKVAAARAYAMTGVPTVELTWTDPEVDAGSRDPVTAPYRGAAELTASLEFPAVEYDDLPLVMCGFFGGAVEPLGATASKTWTHTPASETIDEPDLFTYEFGDDVVEDWYQLGDGIIESFEFTAPVGLGPLSCSTTWRFGSVSSTGSTDAPVTGTVPTPALAVDTNGAKVYLKDIGVYIADDVAGLTTGLITDAVHSFVFRGSQELDLKRYADGDQSYDIDAYGPGARVLEFEATYAKTPDIVGIDSESDDWMRDQSVIRYIRFKGTSTVEASTGPAVYYSWQVTMPMRYYTREEGTEGGNTTVILNAHAFFDAEDYDKVLESIIVNTLTETELGEAAALLLAAQANAEPKATRTRTRKTSRAKAKPEATPEKAEAA